MTVPSREAELEAEIRRLRTQNRRLVDDLNDAEENTRVYRRLAHKQITRCDQLETALAAIQALAFDALNA